MIVAAVNTVISAAYYLRVLRVMILDAPPNGEMPAATNSKGAVAFLSLLAGLVVVAGLLWNPLTEAGKRGVAEFQQSRPR